MFTIMLTLGEEPVAKEAEPKYDPYIDDPLVRGVICFNNLVNRCDAEECAYDSSEIHDVPGIDLKFDHRCSTRYRF